MARRQSYPAILLPLLAISCLSLSACGGGGGGGRTTPAPAPSAPNQQPIARISASVTDGFAPLVVTFDGSGSTDGDGSLSAYRWDFGDSGAAASGVLVSHTYADPGTYTVSLQVTDNAGATNSAGQSVRARGARLEGSIEILTSSAIDSDVNDHLTPIVDNNSFATAQALQNPALLGGFVNLPGTGEPRGNLFVSGDPGDFYTVNLTGNELILLTISEADADLDLFLYDTQEQVVGFSIGIDSTESLSVQQAGAYFIEVFPADVATNVTGASNYVLSIGQDLAPVARSIKRSSDPFVPGELLISTSQATAVHREYGLALRHESNRLALSTVEDFSRTRRAIARRRGNAGNARQDVDPRTARMRRELRGKYATLMALKGLSRDPRVEMAEPNILRFPNRLPDDPLYGLQWHYPAINLPAAWDITTGTPLAGEDPVIVAVIDTGVLLLHPDLDTQLVAGYDFISDPARARDFNGIDGNPNDNGDLAFGASSSFHGTHVAGTIAAQSNNADGVAGVAWNAKIMPVRVLGVDGGTAFDVIQGVRFAAGLSNDSGTLPARRADIINLSLGSSFSSAAEQAVFEEVRAAGVIVVASAGNESSAVPGFPASYAGVISVSATTISNDLAPYSNTGATVDAAAPGGYNATDLNGDGIGDGVVSTLADDTSGTARFGYSALNGTSMAAPHVAGVAALMKSVYPGLTPEEFDAALMAGELTDDLGPPGRDNSFGYGFINAHKAVLTALNLSSGGSVNPGPILNISTSSLNFGILTKAIDVVVENIGSGVIVISAINVDEAWLNVSEKTVNANGLGTYTLTIDRTGLADGAYSAEAMFISEDPSTNDVAVSIVMQVASTNVEANAGLHYVILIDAENETVGNAAVVEASNGSYGFTLLDVPPGNYRLFAGTDNDDDEFLCDTGEACGSYRTLDAPETFSVDANVAPVVDNLDFVSEFRAVITSPSTALSGELPTPVETGLPYSKPSRDVQEP